MIDASVFNPCLGGVCGVGVEQNEHTRQGRLAGSPTPQRTFDRVIFEVVIRRTSLYSWIGNVSLYYE